MVATGSIVIDVYLIAISRNSFMSFSLDSSFEKAGRSVVAIGIARLLTRTVKFIAAL